MGVFLQRLEDATPRKKSRVGSVGSYLQAMNELQIRQRQVEAARQAAALELGSVVLDEGGGELGVDGVRRVIRACVELGPAAALKALEVANRKRETPPVA